MKREVSLVIAFEGERKRLHIFGVSQFILRYDVERSRFHACLRGAAAISARIPIFVVFLLRNYGFSQESNVQRTEKEMSRGELH